ncbi:MAG TPA: hypothetical protein VHE13_17155 [Opitutus sp.]|nr:hypothetical protein [Opitutus sp.]
MTRPEILQRHLQVCNELHTLTLEENSQLRLGAGGLTPAQTERKRTLLARLDESLESLRTLATGRHPELAAAVEKARARTLQILELSRENEQLLLRGSLTRGTASAPAAPAAMLRKVYRTG